MIEQSVSLASNGVVKVPGYEQLVRFGYTKNRGVYRLAVDATGEWDGLTIRAFWHVPGGKDPASSLIVDGSVDVPASVTAQPGNGCITFEGSDGTKTVTSADLRYRVSANSGTEDGTEPEPGTPAWQQLVDAVHTDYTAAEQAKTDAQTAANQADASAGEAAASAKNAGQSAADALVWADAAKKSALAAGSNAQNAAQYAGEAKSSAEQAADSSSAAESSASAAAGSQQAAESSAKKSDASANTAQESATQATGSASKAVQAQKNAETAADRAETAQQKTEEVRTDALDKISAAKADALKAVDAKQADATDAVERTQKKALDAVTAAQGTAVKAVSDAQSTATQAVQTAQTDAVSAVEKAGSEVLESIPKDYQTTVEKVKELKTEKAEIDDTTVGADAWSSKHIVDMLCPPLEESGNPVVCYPVAGYALGVKAKWEPMQEGSGTPSPDNIRPITGRDAVSVTRHGKNYVGDSHVLKSGVYSGVSYTINDDKTITMSGTPTNNVLFSIISYNAGKRRKIYPGTYTISGGLTNAALVFVSYDGNKANSPMIVNKKLTTTGETATFTIDAMSYFGLYAYAYGGQSVDGVMKPQIELGSTATPYEPYTGSTTSITMPETVYGGEVAAVSGDGQETWKTLTLDGTENWKYESDSYFVGHNILNNLPTEIDGKCSHFIYSFNFAGNCIFCTSNSVYTGPELTSKYTDVAAWKAYLAAQYAAGTPVQIAYKLAEPVPFTATGAQPIPALSGTNTVLTDADSATVTGRADPIKRITDLEDAIASMTTT